MLPGLAYGLALAVRPAGAAEVSRVTRRAEGASRAARCEAPLTLEGPPRTIRGVPAPAPTVTARPRSADGRYSLGAIAPDRKTRQSLRGAAQPAADHRLDCPAIRPRR